MRSAGKVPVIRIVWSNGNVERPVRGSFRISTEPYVLLSYRLSRYVSRNVSPVHGLEAGECTVYFGEFPVDLGTCTAAELRLAYDRYRTEEVLGRM